VEAVTPFIEIGYGAGLEASPSVLAKQPVNGSGKRASVREKRTTTAEPDRFYVRFQPYPPEAPPQRPARERVAPALVVVHQPDHPATEQYRQLVSTLMEQLPAGQAQVLLFTAASPETDCTTVMLNVALARAGQTAAPLVIVDANLRQSAVATRLGLPATPGLRDVLAGKIALQRALQEVDPANLKVLAAGKSWEEERGALAGQAMHSVLRHLRDQFQWVLVDAPSWDGRPEVVALGAACDASYLVLPQREAETDATAELLQLIGHQGGRVRGCILTRDAA
jgi:receptor protein-tyrosine kinase